VMMGDEATKIIKQQPQTKHIPVIMLTASAMKETEQMLREVCDGFLTKPVKRKDLLVSLKQFLSYEETKTVEQPADANNHVLAKTKETQRFSVIDPQYNLEKAQRLYEVLLVQTELVEKMRSTLSMDEIEEFAQKLSALAKEHEYQPFLVFAEDLENKVAMFDIDGVSKILNDFSRNLEKLRIICKKTN
jgi:response regulator RpfG family c-di-GMP phosphodiesterase